MESTSNKKPVKNSLFKAFLGGLFGVQSEEQLEKDFTKGEAPDYILIGVMGVVVILIAMGVLVSIVI